MKINGVELEDLDIMDADVAEKYEDALEVVVKNTEALKEIKKGSVVIRKQCELIFEFFNYLFGSGTDEKLFGGKCNLLICMKAFEEVVESVNSQKTEVEKLASKYSMNRAQRRGSKK